MSHQRIKITSVNDNVAVRTKEVRTLHKKYVGCVPGLNAPD